MFRKDERTVLTTRREGSLAKKLTAGGEVGQNKQVILILEPENMSVFIEALHRKRARA